VNFIAKLRHVDAQDLAEKELLEAATYTDPTTLTKNLRELEDRMALNETAEERAVRRREGSWLNLTDTIDQMVSVSGMLDKEQATILRTALYPLSLKAGDVDERSPGRRRADGLTELARIAIRSGQLPETAGEPTQLSVITPLADLLAKLEAGDSYAATLNGAPITPNTARMWACDAGVIPIVLSGDSEILDLGRSTRTWTRAQRKAAKLRAGGHCEAPLCQATIERCELHHERHWANGGPTNIRNGIYLCTFHHWLTHHTHWQITRGDDGKVRFLKT
jgi:transcription elongation GreA/GreB family factor